MRLLLNIKTIVHKVTCEFKEFEFVLLKWRKTIHTAVDLEILRKSL